MHATPLHPKWEDRSHVRDHPRATRGLQAAYVSKLYSVQVILRQTELGPIRQAIIQRHDEAPIVSWRAFQNIKNELFGKETWAVQIYPADSELVDAANMYHLWILPSRPPYGMHAPIIYTKTAIMSQEALDYRESLRREIEKTRRVIENAVPPT